MDKTCSPAPELGFGDDLVVHRYPDGSRVCYCGESTVDQPFERATCVTSKNRGQKGALERSRKRGGIATAAGKLYRRKERDAP